MVRRPKPVQSAAELPAAELKGNFDGEKFENFTFVPYSWHGDGARTGLVEKVGRKLFPVPPDPGDAKPTAARAGFVAPPYAPADCFTFESMAQAYEDGMPRAVAEAFVQITITFRRPLNLNHPFEMVRAWVKQNFADDRELPVFLAVHSPGLAGSENPVHLHAVILPRRLDQLGFGAFDRSLRANKAAKAAFESWMAFKDEWARRWPTVLIDLP